MTTKDFPRALPELRPFLGFFPGFNLTVPPAEGARPFLASFPIPPAPEGISLSNVEIKGGDGQPLRLLVVKPTAPSAQPLPGIVAFFSGGFVMGSPEADIPLYSYFAANGFIVVSPAYRLAPENPYPAAVKDVDATWAHIVSEGGDLGIDISRVSLYGSSAGSALATGLAIRLKSQTTVTQPKVVVLDSTCVDDRSQYPEQAENHELAAYHSVWTRQNHLDISRYYLGSQKDLPVDAFPLRGNVSDLKGLPPHLVSGCELDSLVSNASEYASRLRSAGVSTGLHVWRGTPHAFITLQPDATISKAAKAVYLATFQAESV